MAASTSGAKQHGKKKLMSLHEAIQLVEEDNDIQSADIFIQPPNDGQQSDADSGDDDNVDINNLPRSQLQAPMDMTAVLNNGDNIVISQEDSDDKDDDPPEDDPVPPRKKLKVESLWRKEDLQPNDRTETDWNHDAQITDHLSPTSVFELFWDNDVVDYIIDQTNLYARQNGNHSFQMTRDMFRLFVSILFISGYNSLPRRPMYWEEKDDVRNRAVSGVMSRNDFDNCMKYLHLAPNDNLEAHNKFAKVMPLIRMLKKRFLEFFPVEQNLSIDESMCPYFGKHGAKQCIRGKPIRFGFKQWVLATPLGYIVNILPYQGAEAGIDNVNGLGFSVVEQLVSCLPPLPLHLTFDNFFTSIPLLSWLSEKRLAATGRVRSNRTGNCPMKDPKIIKKEPRGSYDYRHDRKNGIVVAEWNDNNVVTVASNKHGILPIRKVKRWSAKDKTHVQVDQPSVIKVYNHTMGGVDRADQNIGQYRIQMRSKKWTWPLFAFYLDAAAQNAWLRYRKSPANASGPMDQLAFKRSIVHVYLLRHKQDRAIGRPLTGRGLAVPKRVPDEVRKDGENHHLQSGPTQRRCGECGKKSKVSLHKMQCASAH